MFVGFKNIRTSNRMGVRRAAKLYILEDVLLGTNSSCTVDILSTFRHRSLWLIFNSEHTRAIIVGLLLLNLMRDQLHIKNHIRNLSPPLQLV